MKLEKKKKEDLSITQMFSRSLFSSSRRHTRCAFTASRNSRRHRVILLSLPLKHPLQLAFHLATGTKCCVLEGVAVAIEPILHATGRQSEQASCIRINIQGPRLSHPSLPSSFPILGSLLTFSNLRRSDIRSSGWPTCCGLGILFRLENSRYTRSISPRRWSICGTSRSFPPPFDQVGRCGESSWRKLKVRDVDLG